jgi:tRNA-splicing ligase RtcB
MPFQSQSVPNGKPIKLWTDGVPVADEARRQLMNTAQIPFIFRYLAVMPDEHLGKGTTIGSVIPTRGAIIPAAVGVDTGATSSRSASMKPTASGSYCTPACTAPAAP